MKDYRDSLSEQLKNSRIGACRIYYSWLYSQFSSRMRLTGRFLEIGAGAGISRVFLSEHNVIRTDYLPWENSEVLGGIDAQDLPFQNCEFDGVIGMDMIHHVTDPAKLLEEAERVTKPGGSMIFIEPYVSLVSYPIYKFFHPERVTLPFGFDSKKHWVSQVASDGDQSVAQRLFCTRSGRKYITGRFGEQLKVEVDFLSPTAFYLTGGLNNPTNMPAKIIELFIKLDERVPRALRRLTASRMLVRIEKLI